MELSLSTPSSFRLPIPPLLFLSPKHPQLPSFHPSSLSCPPIRPYVQRIPLPRAPMVPVRKPVIRACTRVGAAGNGPILRKISDFREVCWRFLRPHTIRGTALGSISLVTRALIENSHLIKWSLLFKAFSGLFALICGNGYIVGINQIYDVGIDKVNKPYLPIAAGDLSTQNAWILVIFFAVTGLAIVVTNFGPFITSLYSLGLLLGTIYSVPPFRMKKYPVVAFLIIATVRGFLLNFGVYYATRAALGLAFEWSLPVAFITTFVTLFAFVIAITKDLPDVEGDRKFQISTFATKLGVRNIAFLGTGILLLNYIGSISAVIYLPQAFRWSVMIPVHTILALSLIFQTWVLERANYTKDAIGGFYRWIWNLFYAELMMFFPAWKSKGSDSFTQRGRTFQETTEITQRGTAAAPVGACHCSCRPSQYARRIEEISLVFKNLNHLLNLLPPHKDVRSLLYSCRRRRDTRARHFGWILTNSYVLSERMSYP